MGVTAPLTLAPTRSARETSLSTSPSRAATLMWLRFTPVMPGVASPPTAGVLRRT
jgi:hypothetical protein